MLEPLEPVDPLDPLDYIDPVESVEPVEPLRWILLASICWSCLNNAVDIMVPLPGVLQFLLVIVWIFGYTLLTVWAARYSKQWAVFVPGHAVVLYTVAVLLHSIEIHSICQIYALMLLFGSTLIYSCRDRLQTDA